MMKKKLMKYMQAGSLIMLLVALTGCKKDVKSVLPGNTESTAINFYSASDAFYNAYSNGQVFTAIYVDKDLKLTVPADNTYNFAVFGYGMGVGSMEYPNTQQGEDINYARYPVGSKRLMFTDTTHTIVLDTTINAKVHSQYCIYFTDKAGTVNSIAAYHAVVVEEGQPVPADKTGVRFINISPDAGELTASLQQADGSMKVVLPNIKTGIASAYQYFEEKDVANGLLRFTLSGAALQTPVVSGVPFMAGHSYVVVVQGFLIPQVRQFISGKNADGSLKYTTLTIPRSLRAEVRTSF